MAKKIKRRVLPTYLMHPVISKERAEREGVIVLSSTEYANRFHVHRQTAIDRYRTLKVRGFKHKGRIFLVVSKDSKDGL